MLDIETIMSLLYCQQKEDTAAWAFNPDSRMIKDSHSEYKNKAWNCFFMNINLECLRKKKNPQTKKPIQNSGFLIQFTIYIALLLLLEWKYSLIIEFACLVKK